MNGSGHPAVPGRKGGVSVRVSVDKLEGIRQWLEGEQTRCITLTRVVIKGKREWFVVGSGVTRMAESCHGRTLDAALRRFLKAAKERA